MKYLDIINPRVIVYHHFNEIDGTVDIVFNDGYVLTGEDSEEVDEVETPLYEFGINHPNKVEDPTGEEHLIYLRDSLYFAMFIQSLVEKGCNPEPICSEGGNHHFYLINLEDIAKL
jgi:hypothetical protein